MASSLVVGTDTYISAADALTYLQKNYLSTDAKLVAYAALSESDKDVVLRKAAQVLDRQPLAGYKADTTQTMAFPRALYTTMYIDGNLTVNLLQNNSLYIETVVSNAVKYAQCEVAISFANGANPRLDMQREGVKSFSIGSLSESYGSGRDNALPYEARELLKMYLAGSVPII